MKIEKTFINSFASWVIIRVHRIKRFEAPRGWRKLGILIWEELNLPSSQTALRFRADLTIPIILFILPQIMQDIHQVPKAFCTSIFVNLHVNLIKLWLFLKIDDMISEDWRVKTCWNINRVNCRDDSWGVHDGLWKRNANMDAPRVVPTRTWIWFTGNNKNPSNPRFKQCEQSVLCRLKDWTQWGVYTTAVELLFHCGGTFVSAQWNFCSTAVKQLYQYSEDTLVQKHNVNPQINLS